MNALLLEAGPEPHEVALVDEAVGRSGDRSDEAAVRDPARGRGRSA